MTTFFVRIFDEIDIAVHQHGRSGRWCHVQFCHFFPDLSDAPRPYQYSSTTTGRQRWHHISRRFLFQIRTWYQYDGGCFLHDFEWGIVYISISVDTSICRQMSTEDYKRHRCRHKSTSWYRQIIPKSSGLRITLGPGGIGNVPSSTTDKVCPHIPNIRDSKWPSQAVLRDWITSYGTVGGIQKSRMAMNHYTGTVPLIDGDENSGGQKFISRFELTWYWY